MVRRLHLTIRGRVQGVSFRVSAREKARVLELRGIARNLPDGEVDIVAEGEEDALRAFESWCYSGSRGASVTRVEAQWEDPQGAFTEFTIE